MDKQDLEFAIDMTYLALTDPTLLDQQIVVESQDELTSMHYALIRALENLEDLSRTKKRG